MHKIPKRKTALIRTCKILIIMTLRESQKRALWMYHLSKRIQQNWKKNILNGCFYERSERIPTFEIVYTSFRNKLREGRRKITEGKEAKKRARDHALQGKCSYNKSVQTINSLYHWACYIYVTNLKKISLVNSVNHTLFHWKIYLTSVKISSFVIHLLSFMIWVFTISINQEYR